MPTPKKKSPEFSEFERAAMKERAEELIAEKHVGKKGKPDGEAMLQEKIAAMEDPDRSIATRIHELVKAHAPELRSKTWYGMPAYALDDKVVCFFQEAKKFKARYATLGFSDVAHIDEGNMWATSFALTTLTPAEESKIVKLIKKAVSK